MEHFKGAFSDAANENGIHVDYASPENHSEIGLVERHNSTLRSILERIVDCRGVTDEFNMKIAITGSLFGKNACTWPHASFHSGIGPHSEIWHRSPFESSSLGHGFNCS